MVKCSPLLCVLYIPNEPFEIGNNLEGENTSAIGCGCKNGKSSCNTITEGDMKLVLRSAENVARY